MLKDILKTTLGELDKYVADPSIPDRTKTRLKRLRRTIAETAADLAAERGDGNSEPRTVRVVKRRRSISL